MQRFAHRHLSFAASTCVLVLTSATLSHARSDQPQNTDVSSHTDLQLMKQQIENLQRDNQSMKGEIDTLRAKTEDNWLTEARADEIRGLVEDVLADADTRASLLQDGLMAGWSEHFFLADAYGRFKLVVDGMMQIRWVYNYTERPPGPFSTGDQHLQGFENTRTRLTFSGHVFTPDLQYLIRGNFARGQETGGPAGGVDFLLDAWVRYNITNNWSVRFGQFKLPFNREELVSPAQQLAVERSLVNEALNIGRSQGIELSYHDSANAVSVMISDGASGNQNGVGLSQQAGTLLTSNRTNTTALTPDVEYAITGRYERLFSGAWEQFDDFTSPRDDEFGMLLGVAVHAQDSESTGVSSPVGQQTNRGLGGTVDLSMEWGGANAFASLTHHYIDSAGLGVVNFTGIVIQGGFYLTPKWEIFARGEYAQVEGEQGVAIPDLNVITAGANYYIEGHDVKWTTDISFGISDVSGIFASDLAGFRGNADETNPQVVFRTQFQLLF